MITYDAFGLTERVVAHRVLLGNVAYVDLCPQFVLLQVRQQLDKQPTTLSSQITIRRQRQWLHPYQLSLSHLPEAVQQPHPSTQVLRSHLGADGTLSLSPPEDSGCRRHQESVVCRLQDHAQNSSHSPVLDLVLDSYGINFQNDIWSAEVDKS
eukprot:6770567-Pyramimonas_sp.AAC.2